MDRRRLARAALATVVIAGMARLALGRGVVGYDGMYGLLWGAQLGRGEAPDLEVPTAPTPHPLVILGGLVARGSPWVFETLAFLALGALAVAAFALGRVVAGSFAGVLFAVVLVTREPVVFGTLQALVDVPFLALSLGAVALLARGQHRGAALGLLVAAGLLRPEGWALAGAASAYLAWRGDGPPRAALAAAALAAPLVWALTDLVLTGDPLHSLTATQDLAERLGRPRGLGTALDHAPDYLEIALGRSVALAGVAGLVVAAVLRPGALAWPLALLVLGLLGFVVLGIADLPLLVRYALLPGAGLVLCLAVGASAHVVAAVVLVGIALTGGPGDRDRIDGITDQIRERRGLEASLRALARDGAARRAAERCGTVYVPNSLPVPLLALELGRRATEVRSAALEEPRAGTLVLPAPATARAYLLDPREAPAPTVVPPGFRRAAANADWAIYSTC